MQTAFKISEAPGSPALGFYATIPTLFTLPHLSHPRFASVQGLRTPVALGGSAENASCSVILYNGDGELSELLSPPPLAREGIIYYESAGVVSELFRGVIVAVTFADIVRVNLES